MACSARQQEQFWSCAYLAYFHSRSRSKVPQPTSTSHRPTPNSPLLLFNFFVCMIRGYYANLLQAPPFLFVQTPSLGSTPCLVFFFAFYFFFPVFASKFGHYGVISNTVVSGPCRSLIYAKLLLRNGRNNKKEHCSCPVSCLLPPAAGRQLLLYYFSPLAAFLRLFQESFLMLCHSIFEQCAKWVECLWNTQNWRQSGWVSGGFPGN